MDEQVPPTPPITPLPGEPSAPSAGISQTPSARGMKFVWMGALLLVLGGAGALAYVSGFLHLGRPKTPEAVIERMLAGVLDIKSAAYVYEASFRAEEREAGAVPWSLLLPEASGKNAALARDRTRLQDINLLQAALNTYVLQNKTAPLRLEQLLELGQANADIIRDSGSLEMYGYRQEAGGADFVLHVALETDEAVEAYRMALGDLGAAVIRSPRVVELTSKSPRVYAVLDEAESSPYPLGFLGDNLYEYLPVEIEAAVTARGHSQSDVTLVDDAAYELDGSLVLGGLSFSVGAQLRKIGEDYYARITEAPSLGLFDLGALKHTWVHAVPQDAYGTILGSTLYRGGENDVNAQSAQFLRQYQRILRLLAQEEVLEVVNEYPKVQDGDRSLYHYQVRIDREKFTSFYKLLTEEMKTRNDDTAWIEFNDKTLEYLESAEFAGFYEVLDQNVSLELWIDDATYWPTKFTYSLRLVPPDTVPKLANRQYRFELSLGLDQVNAPVVVAVPSPTISVDEARVLLTGEVLTEVKLRRQIAQVEAIRTALAAYHAHTGDYPIDVTALLQPVSEVPAGSEGEAEPGSFELERLKSSDEAFLRVIPMDVYTGQAYVYASDGVSYTLEYTVQLPEPREDAPLELQYDYLRTLFAEGRNTATAQTLSREGNPTGARRGSGSFSALDALSPSQGSLESARIQSNVGQMRTLAEVYYDGNNGSYAGFDQCVKAPSDANCGADIASSVTALAADLTETYGQAALTANASQGKFCLSHPLPDASSSCTDSNGSFVVSPAAACGAALDCPN